MTLQDQVFLLRLHEALDGSGHWPDPWATMAAFAPPS